MGRIYVIKKIHDIAKPDTEIQKMLDASKPACIDNFPWDENGYRPKSEARVLYSSLGLHVMLKSCETELKADYKKMNDPVYKDSCLEFFLNPVPDLGTEYLNFEFNPLGTLLLGCGPDRYHRKAFDEKYLGLFNIRHSIIQIEQGNCKEFFWNVKFFIPFSFLEEYFSFRIAGKARMTGNFYKCGDETPFPHFGCWNPIFNPVPDFHRPEHFGELLLG